MSENKLMAPPRRISPRRQAGVAAVEFAFLVAVFLLFLFSVIEMARIMYLWNTLQEVTRRAASAAASTDFSDVSAMNKVRQQAVFRTIPGGLPIGDPVKDTHVRIDYMSLSRAPNGKLTLTPIPSGALPSCPARNQVACTTDPNSSSCVRFVRVRICAPGGDPGNCDAVTYVPMLPLVKVESLSLPPSTTIVRAESLGYQAGQSLCP